MNTAQNGTQLSELTKLIGNVVGVHFSNGAGGNFLIQCLSMSKDFHLNEHYDGDVYEYIIKSHSKKEHWEGGNKNFLCNKNTDTFFTEEYFDMLHSIKHNNVELLDVEKYNPKLLQIKKRWPLILHFVDNYVKPSLYLINGESIREDCLEQVPLPKHDDYFTVDMSLVYYSKKWLTQLDKICEYLNIEDTNHDKVKDIREIWLDKLWLTKSL